MSELKGYLVGADRYKLTKVDFVTFPPVVTNLVDDPDLLVMSVAKFDKENFLYHACRKSTGICNIYKYNLESQSVKTVREGYVPVCVKEHNRMFFYKRYENDDFYLVVSNCDKSGSVEKLFKTRYAGNLVEVDTQPAVIQISADEILYRDQQTSQLMRYHILEARSISTGMVNCTPLAWRSKTKQVLCRNVTTAQFYLLNLENGNEVIPEYQRFDGAVYLAKYDALIHHSAGYRFPIGERYDTYLYTFESGVNVRIAEHVSMRSAIWFSEAAEVETVF